MNIDKLLSTSFKWDKRETILNELSHKNKVKFALFCAKQVKHLLNNKEAIQAIDIVELFLEDKATAEECRKASNAAYTVANTAYAASAAAYTSAAYTAYTATTAYTAASAASYAASAASYAAHAAYTAINLNNPNNGLNKDQLKQEQMDYLRIVVLSELSEEERDNWLLIASI